MIQNRCEAIGVAFWTYGFLLDRTVGEGWTDSFFLDRTVGRIAFVFDAVKCGVY